MCDVIIDAILKPVKKEKTQLDPMLQSLACIDPKVKMSRSEGHQGHLPAWVCTSTQLLRFYRPWVKKGDTILLSISLLNI